MKALAIFLIWVKTFQCSTLSGVDMWSPKIDAKKRLISKKSNISFFILAIISFVLPFISPMFVYQNT